MGGTGGHALLVVPTAISRNICADQLGMHMRKNSKETSGYVIMIQK